MRGFVLQIPLGHGPWRGCEMELAWSRARERYPGAIGVLCFLAALLLFAVFDAGSKYFVATLPAPFLNAARFWAFMMVGVVLITRRGISPPRQENGWFLLGVRGIALASAGTCFMTALLWMPLGEASAIYFTAPLLVVALSGPVLGERVAFTQWLAVAIGFVGMLLVVRPAGQLPLLGTFLMIIAGISYAIYQLVTRKLSSQNVPIQVQYATTGLISLILTTVPALFFLPRPWPPARTLLAVFLLCLCNATGHLLIIAAFQRIKASILAPLNYLQLVLAVTFSMLFFAAIPDHVTSVGIVLITLSGIAVAMTATQRRN